LSQKENLKTKKTIFSSYLKLHNIKQETISKFLTQKENLKTKKTIFFKLFKIAQYKAGNEFRKSQLF